MASTATTRKKASTSPFQARVWRPRGLATSSRSPPKGRPSPKAKWTKSSLLDLFMALLVFSSFSTAVFYAASCWYETASFGTNRKRQDWTVSIKDPSPAVVHHQPTTNSDRVLKQKLGVTRAKNSTSRVLKQNLGVTSAMKSTYRLKNRRLYVGDTAHFIIQATDADGRKKVTGGDFWFPVVTSDVSAHPVKGGRTAGKVVDHNNGTYSVFFYVAWEGFIYVHMTLAAPSEATKWLRTKYWPLEKRAFWNGEFAGTNPLDGQKTTETTLCYLLRDVTSPKLCRIDYNPKAMGLTALYCRKPERVKCSDFKTIRMNGDYTFVMNRIIVGKEKRFFQGENYMTTLRKGPRKIPISEAQKITEHQAPDCRPNNEPLMNDGFWLNDDWHHLQCKVRRWNDVQAVKGCLRHKHVFILGDSNVRCWYKVLMKKIGYPEWNTLDNEEHARISMKYKNAVMEMSFHSHPHLVTNVKTTLNETLYEVDVLDNIPSDSCGKYIIVLCPWGHFTQWTIKSFIERTQLLKEAVVRFRKRCPDVPIVIKGAHARDHTILEERVYASDYTIWNLGVILKETFRGTGLYYYDIWQMSLAYGKQDMHMPVEVIEEEVNWFLSYVCK